MDFSCLRIFLVAILATRMTEVEGIVCYSCQYSDNLNKVGYECVYSPADYTLGPTTTECASECSSEAQQISGSDVIYFMLRGCKTKPDGCTGGGIDICIESCSNADLCNNKSYAPNTTPPPPSTLSTMTPTTTTEIPGTITCYSCVYSYNPDVDDSCVTDAPNAPPPNEVRCPPTRVCTIFRQWDKGLQVVRSFARNCEEQQGNVNRCVEDLYFETCFTYCNTNYCNSGDGTLPRRFAKARAIAPAPAAAAAAAAAVDYDEEKIALEI